MLPSAPRSVSRATRAPSCALCGKPQVAAHAPFCSAGCKDRDLLNWLGEGYAVPGEPADNALDNGGGGD